MAGSATETSAGLMRLAADGDELAEGGIGRALVDDARVRHLLTVPGIGLQNRGRLGRPHRRRRLVRPPDTLVGYIGLDPIVR